MAESASHLTITADETKAVQAYLRVVEAQSKLRGGLKDTTRAGKETSSMLGEMAGSLTKIGASMLAIGTLKSIVTAPFEAISKQVAGMREFEGQLRKLWGIPGNLGNMAGVRSQVIAMSDAWGESADAVIEAQRTIQERVGHMGPAMEKNALDVTLKLNDALERGLPAAANLAARAYQTFGEKLGTPSEALDKLAAFGRALPSTEDPAEFLGAIAASAKDARLSFTAMTAIVERFDREGGKTKETVAALREVFHALAEEQRTGMVPETANLTDRFQALRNQMSPYISTEHQALFKGATENAAEIQKRQEELDKQKDREEQDRLKKMNDANARAQQLGKVFDTTAANVGRNALNQWGNTQEDLWKAAEIGAKARMPSSLAWFRKPAQWIGNVTGNAYEALTGNRPLNYLEQAGINETVNQQLEAGDELGSQINMVRFAKKFFSQEDLMPWQDRRTRGGNHVYEMGGDAEVAPFLMWRKSHPGGTAAEYFKGQSQRPRVPGVPEFLDPSLPMPGAAAPTTRPTTQPAAGQSSHAMHAATSALIAAAAVLSRNALNARFANRD